MPQILPNQVWNSQSEKGIRQKAKLQWSHDVLEEGWSQCAELVGMDLRKECDEFVVLLAQGGELEQS